VSDDVHAIGDVSEDQVAMQRNHPTGRREAESCVFAMNG
jgi:hypothetical protein